MDGRRQEHACRVARSDRASTSIEGLTKKSEFVVPEARAVWLPSGPLVAEISEMRLGATVRGGRGYL